MKAMSIIGIILFTWLLYVRFEQYQATIDYVGRSVTYSDAAWDRMKYKAIAQIAVSAYALVYAVFGTVYFFKRMAGKPERKSDADTVQ